MFRKAQKTQLKLRLALMGPPGSGKSYSALMIAKHLGGKIAAIDTEHSSLSKYSDIADFDVCELTSFHANQYIETIRAASEAGYDVLIIDSMSHLWSGKDGILEQVDRIAKRDRSGNSFSAWKDVNPMLTGVIEAILASPLHVISTFRTKVEYVVEPNEKGKLTPRKVGLAPVFKDQVEYEYDLVGELNLDNELVISKSRCPALSGQVIVRPGRQIADVLSAWLSDGVPAPPPIDRDFLLSQTEQQMNRLGWSAKDGKLHLEQTYGKKSRQFLTDEELIEFSAYLQSQPDPSEHLA